MLANSFGGSKDVYLYCNGSLFLDFLLICVNFVVYLK